MRNLRLSVTDRCNLRCPTCYAGSGPDVGTHRSLAQIEAMLDRIVANEGEADVVQVSGGEPTLHPDFFAILDACRIRLRPVMMTMVSTVLGGVPLILSSGAGAEAREALGWVIVGGLGMATLSTLYLTPVAYFLLARFTTPKAAEEARLQAELSEAQLV